MICNGALEIWKSNTDFRHGKNMAERLRYTVTHLLDICGVQIVV